MRKSERKISARPLWAGVFVATTVAAATGIAAPAAFASPTALLQTNTAPIGGGTTITAGATGSGSFPVASAAAVSARLVASTVTCPSAYGTTGTAVTVSAVHNDDSVDLVVPNVTAGIYKFCFYGVAAGSTVGSATTLLTSSDNLTVSVATTKPVLSSPAGLPAGGNTVTATLPGPWITATGAPGAVFTTATCPTTYTTTTGNITATATKNDAKTVATLTVPTTLTLGTGYNVCFYSGVTGTSALMGSSSTTYTTRPATTVSPGQGSSATSTNVAISSTATAAFLSTSTTPGVLFTRNACPATYDTTDAANKAGTSVVKISNYKLSAKVPTSVALSGSEATAQYNVCTYAGTSGDPLVGTPTTYTIAPTLTVTGVASGTMGGSAQGGSAVTITGTGFPTDPNALLTAWFGTSPVTITSVSNDGHNIYGTTTAHAPGAVYPTVVTAAGSRTATSGNQFTFSYGITISPNTAPSPTASSPFYLDVLGAGFDALSWPTTWATGNDTHAHVFMLDNTGYDPSWVTAPVTECINVIKISDGELICTLDLYKKTVQADGTLLAGTAVGTGTYTIAVVANGGTGVAQTPGTTISDVTSGSTFTVANY
jgi:hypothetical protein